jgi:hypothetical protein
VTGRHDIDGLSHPVQVRLVRYIARVSGVRARRQSHEIMTCFDYPRDSDQVERQVGLGDANEGRRGVGEVDTSRGGKSESESERQK